MNDIELMIKSKDKDSIYTAYTMLKNDFQGLIENKNKLLNQIDLFDQIRDYSDICFKLGEKELTIDNFNFIQDENIRLRTFRFYQIKNIEKVFNGDWVPNWNDTNEYKYYPWFKICSSGLIGFYDCGYVVRRCGAEVGFFKTKEISDFVGKTFLNIYSDIIK